MIEEFKELSLNVFMRDWVSCISFFNSCKKRVKAQEWVLQCIEKVKLNFKRFFLKNLGPVGFGCVICDDQDNVLCVVSGPLGSRGSNEAELKGLLEDCIYLKKTSNGYLVEGDRWW